MATQLTMATRATVVQDNTSMTISDNNEPETFFNFHLLYKLKERLLSTNSLLL
jgi:hypothetical protein